MNSTLELALKLQRELNAKLDGNIDIIQRMSIGRRLQQRIQKQRQRKRNTLSFSMFLSLLAIIIGGF
jgi:hypothetical protein